MINERVLEVSDVIGRAWCTVTARYPNCATAGNLKDEGNGEIGESIS